MGTQALLHQHGWRPRWPQVARIARRLAAGLAAVHAAGVVHRDLKADNIMSHNGIYKIVDLGFAKMIPKDS